MQTEEQITQRKNHEMEYAIELDVLPDRCSSYIHENSCTGFCIHTKPLKHIQLQTTLLTFLQVSLEVFYFYIKSITLFHFQLGTLLKVQKN